MNALDMELIDEYLKDTMIPPLEWLSGLNSDVKLVASTSFSEMVETMKEKSLNASEAARLASIREKHRMFLNQIHHL